MAKPVKKKVETPEIVKKTFPKYKLRRDMVTSKGVKKKGDMIEASEAAKQILTKQKYI
tara:strand:+ start:453 stop:626 length:174 start_codon:yes stop_codon:yes gene_type:complete